MGALYALLGLVVGIAITEAVRGRVGNRGTQITAQSGRGSRWPSAAQSGKNAHSAGRFAAQDFYDR